MSANDRCCHHLWFPSVLLLLLKSCGCCCCFCCCRRRSEYLNWISMVQYHYQFTFHCFFFFIKRDNWWQIIVIHSFRAEEAVGNFTLLVSSWPQSSWLINSKHRTQKMNTKRLNQFDCKNFEDTLLTSRRMNSSL